MASDTPLPTTDELHRLYSAALQAVLLDFQFIEEGLRRYIAGAYDLIRKRVDGEIAFKLSAKDLEKDSLGRLLVKFCQLSDNSALQATIAKLVPDRNICAHKGLLITHQLAEAPAGFEKLTATLWRLRERTTTCVRDVIAECEKVSM